MSEQLRIRERARPPGRRARPAPRRRQGATGEHRPELEQSRSGHRLHHSCDTAPPDRSAVRQLDDAIPQDERALATPSRERRDLFDRLEPGTGGVHTIDLPHRERLEEGLGVPLGHLEVVSGSAVARALDRLDAEAAAEGDRIYLPSPDAGTRTVAHEVAHTLQARGGGAVEADRAIGPMSVGAELEAERVAAAVEAGHAGGAPTVTHALAADALALRTAIAPAVPAPHEAAPPVNRFEAALEEDRPEPVEAEPTAAGPEETGEGPSEMPPPAVEIEEIAPTFDVPPLPETELSPEEQARREEELAAAAAAMEQADAASGVIGAFADAPPSLKARLQGEVGGRVGEVTEREEAEFAAEVPALEITMGGEISDEEVASVEAPAAGELVLEEGAPRPAGEPDLPPTEDPGAFDGNAQVRSAVDRILGIFGIGPESIAQSFSQVKTSDPDIETSPGEKPEVPVEPGTETDPGRVDEQHREGTEQAGRARDEATRAVLDGPGPERAKLKELKEERSIGELATPEIEGVAEAEGAQQYQALALPEELQAQFDKDLHATMRDNLADARSQSEAAEQDRDEQRQQALDTAENDRRTLVEEADTRQREEVLGARETIQRERQSTLEAQTEAVRGLEGEAETERSARRDEIDNRVREDEQKISDEYEAAEADADREVAAGEEKADGERRAAEREAENQSWWDKATSFIKEAFAALTEVINGIFDAVRDAVKVVLDAARDFAKGLIDAAAAFIKDAIAAFGEALKGLVNTLLESTFPELAEALNQAIDGAVAVAQEAVDAVAENLKAGVDAVVDALQKGLDAIIAAYQAALNFAVNAVQAVLTGDWAAVLKPVLEAALKLLGIDPQEFYAFIAQIMDTLGLIVEQPGQFLSNLLDGVLLGFSKFADNFLTHLKKGVIGWLTGALGDIQLPEKWDIWGVLDLVRQILGLTWDWLKQRAAKLIGEKNVERLEYLFSWIGTLITEGWSGLFERIKDELADLKDQLLGQIKEFLLIQVIKAGITWLAGLFNPVGALVKVVMTVWNIYTFLRDQLARIIEVVRTVVGALDKIARGIIEDAALKVESVLGNLLPVAIDLVAKLIGITGVAAKVRDIIKTVRKKIADAADRLLAKIAGKFKGKADTPAEAEDKAPEGVQVGEVMKVADPAGPAHTLSIDIEGKDATVMLRSEPKPVIQWLNSFEARLPKIEDDGRRGAVGKQLDKAVGILRQLDPEADQFLSEALTTTPAGGAKKPAKKPDDSKVDAAEGHLRDALVELFKVFGSPLEASFEEQVKAVHDLVRRPLQDALAREALRYQAMTWPEVRKDLELSTSPFAKPMLKEHDFGKKVQDEARAELGRRKDEEGVPTGDQIDPFLKNYLVRLVNNEGGVHAAARGELQDVMFGSGALGSLNSFKPALEDALDRSRKGEGADEVLVKTLSGKPVEFSKFLIAMAEGRDFGPLKAADWKPVYWGKPANQGWIKDRFRRGGGLHEWVPTNYIDRVIDRAKAARQSEDAEAAGRWMRFQDTFRTETEFIIFAPEGDTVQTVPYARDPLDTSKKAKSSPVEVLQGHTGAIYAPVKGGDYAAKVVPQVVGQNTWHNGLRDIFDTSFSKSNSEEGMRGILQDMTHFIADSLWFGDPATTGFEEYYSKAKDAADGKDLVPPSALTSRAKRAVDTIQADIDRTRKAMEL